MITQISMDVETEAGTLQDLMEAIALREKYLKQDTGDAMVAMTITILRSLKAATPKAKTDVSDAMYKIVATDMYGGYWHDGGKRRVVARVGSHSGHRSHIRPAMGFDAHDPSAVLRSRVYAIYTTNPHDRFEKNVNAPAMCWYVLCEHEGQAEAYAKNHIARLLRKEAGMAKYALSIAQSQASTRGGAISLTEAQGNGGMSPHAVSLAYGASELAIDDSGWSDGNVSVYFFDHLNYSLPASGGEGAVNAAIEKAVKSTVGMIEKKTGEYFADFHKRDFKTSRSVNTMNQDLY